MENNIVFIIFANIFVIALAIGGIIFWFKAIKEFFKR